MKSTRIILVALFLAAAFAAAGSAATSISAGIHIGPSGRASVDLGFFYDDLASYGNWVERPHYGWVWHPRAVASTWRPYAYGHWAWTDEGWIWISDEPYGWATYHYGRWYFDPDYGWEWVPGNEWAPAWVSWQEGDDYIGWAPLPPSVDFRPGRIEVSLAPTLFVFVPARQFLAPRVVAYAVPRQECERIYRTTRNVTEYQVINQRIVNRGVAVDRIQRVVGRPVPRYQVAVMDANQRHQGGRIAQNRIEVFRPQVEQAKVAPPPERPVARRAVMAAPEVRANRGARGPQTQPQAPKPMPEVQPARPGRQPRQEVQAPAPQVQPVRPGRQPRQEVPPADTQTRQNANGRRQNPPRGEAVQPQQPEPPAAREQDQPRPPRQQAQPQQQPQPRGQGQGQNKGQAQDQGKGKGKDKAKDQGKGHDKPKDNNEDKKPPQP